MGKLDNDGDVEEVQGSGAKRKGTMSERTVLLRALRAQVRKEMTANKNLPWKEVVDFVAESEGELPPGVYACLLQCFDPARIQERKARYGR
jgi:hypothetical protein